MVRWRQRRGRWEGSGKDSSPHPTHLIPLGSLPVCTTRSVGQVSGPFLSDSLGSLFPSFEALEAISTWCSFRSLNLGFPRSRAHQGLSRPWWAQAGLRFSITPGQNGKELKCQPDTDLQPALLLSDMSLIGIDTFSSPLPFFLPSVLVLSVFSLSSLSLPYLLLLSSSQRILMECLVL